MPSATVIAESYSFSPSAMMELWTLDGRTIGVDTVYYFCDAISANFQPITYNGITYTPFPIKVDNMDLDGKGSQTRPRLTVSNAYGFVSNLLRTHGQLNGAIVTRIRVRARFLDASNFPSPRPSWVTPDTTAAYAPEPFIINRKISEIPGQIVSFELGTPL